MSKNICVIRVKQFLRSITLSTLYFNFHYFPFKTAIKRPVILYNVKFKDLKGKVIIDHPEITTGMIRIGRPNRNFWCTDTTSTLDLRGGNLVFKGKCLFRMNAHIRIEKNGLIEIGNGVTFASGSNLISYYHISIGDFSHLGWDVTIMDSDFHPILDIIGNRYLKTCAPVNIGANCWIGAKASIMKGVKLPNHSIVTFNSVVNSRFRKENIIISGNPAKEIDEGYTITEETFYNYPVISKEMLNKRKSKY